MSKYDSILFDFDGVLVDSEPVHFKCWRDTLGPFGISLDWETYRTHCIGISDQKMLEFLGARAQPKVSADRLWEVYDQKAALFRRRMREERVVPAATRAILDDLSGYRKAVVSSAGGPEVKPILKDSGIDRYFLTIVCGDDVECHKPDPEPYLLAAGRLGVSAPLVVEDSAAGAESGRAAGFDVLVVDRADRTAELLRAKLDES